MEAGGGEGGEGELPCHYVRILDGAVPSGHAH